MRAPSGLNATSGTHSSWVRRASSRPVALSRTRAFLSTPAVVRMRVVAYLSVADGGSRSCTVDPWTDTFTLAVVGEFAPGTPLVISNSTTIIVEPGR